jgi:hypothetical protein
MSLVQDNPIYLRSVLILSSDSRLGLIGFLSQVFCTSTMCDTYAYYILQPFQSPWYVAWKCIEATSAGVDFISYVGQVAFTAGGSHFYF